MVVKTYEQKKLKEVKDRKKSGKKVMPRALLCKVKVLVNDLEWAEVAAHCTCICVFR